MVNRQLLAACRNGDQRAFEEVVRLTHRQVYTQAYRLVGDRQDAEDVTQDAYLRAFRGLSGFRGDAQFETWLYRIVANAALSHLRRKHRLAEVLTEPEDDPTDQAQQVGLAERAVDRDALESALAACGELRAGRSAVRDVVGDPSDGFRGGFGAAAPRRRLVRRVAGDERVQHAAFSIGGAVVGATAIGLLWWRAARRELAPAP